ncbi:MAG: right-handed parallel beta-helix repeat-containing protein [Thermomicrobiales bacterium]
MEHERDDQDEDAVDQVMGRRWVRRRVVGLLAGPLAGLGLGAASTAKKKKKKVTLCLNGQTLKVPKKKRGSLQRQGATAGACTACVASCAGKPCGADDGCGGECGCPAGQVCGAGVCQACNVVCAPGDPAACGAALQARFDAGGAVFACPGRYVGRFTLNTDVALYGAGEGSDPATSTILDANQTGPVFSNYQTTTVERVRFTGGKVENGSAGVLNAGTLTVRRSTVTGNVVTGYNGWGAGVRQNDATGPLTMTNCTITGNRTDNSGGGIAQSSATQPVILTNCTISDNHANLDGYGDGGGIYCWRGVVTITGGSITNNRGKDGGGIAAAPQGTVTLSGVSMSGNDPTNCVGVPGCPA